MIAGRKPKPTAVHIANGNPGRRPRKKVTPSAPPGVPEPFPHLSDKVQAAWRDIGKVLDDVKVVTLAHGHALELIAGNIVEVRELRAEVEKYGRYQNVRTTNGSKKQVIRPAVLALSDAEKRLRAMMEQFGLTPSAETRVNERRSDEKEKENPAAKYFTKPTLVHSKS